MINLSDLMQQVIIDTGEIRFKSCFHPSKSGKASDAAGDAPRPFSFLLFT
jgi:hypothetical protein